jgi:hypothetical protein
VKSELFPDKWILQHDHTTSHNTLPVKEIFANKSIVVLKHSNYSARPPPLPCRDGSSQRITFRSRGTDSEGCGGRSAKGKSKNSEENFKIQPDKTMKNRTDGPSIA